MPKPGAITIEKLSRLAFTDEAQALSHMLEKAQLPASTRESIRHYTSELIRNMRESGMGAGMEAFLQEYRLDTQEGVAIMWLAEALLRIPDNATADALIESVFAGTDWHKHTGHSDVFMVNASSWGLLFSGAIVKLGEEPHSLLKNLLNRMGEPVVREALKRAIHMLGSRFVLGETIESALKHARPYEKQGYLFSYDILGEGARTQAQADTYFTAYRHALETVAEGGAMSVKLSGLHPRYQLVKKERLFTELLPKLRQLIALAKARDIAISIDAEEANRFDINLILFTALFEDTACNGYEKLGFVLQAYQKRAYHTVDYLAALAQRYNRQIPVRLVKGAYWDAEIKHAQMMGLPDYPVFTRKEHTDVSYLACAAKLLEYGGAFFPQFATHNALTVATIQHMAEGKPYEFQRLYGMGDVLYQYVLKDAPCRIYAPVGKHQELLPYLIRRLLENGASTSFVNQFADKTATTDDLLQQPVDKTQVHGGTPNPSIPPPIQLYGVGRNNSKGLDFGYLALQENVTDLSMPAITLPSSDPDRAMAEAYKAFPEWNGKPVEQRAILLEAAADALEARAKEFYALCVEEARKTLPDAVAEVREAVDFCRYYAMQARKLMSVPHVLSGPTGEHNALSLSGRGVFVCISPWNFPLAIFTGQVAAALVTGNTVIAKPAEQTPRIAALAVRILHESGIPANVLQLVPGKGSDVGAALVEHPHTAGVVFTGSTATARRINRMLACKEGAIVPLIAETGGQNAMIIDSSALLEQAVDDVVLSAFGSAGQRCSALRVAYVQEEIADDFCTVLAGAMQELTSGNPGDLSTDIGPVIDETAWQRLREHLLFLGKKATHIATAPASLCDGYFIAPHAYEIPSIHLLKGEVFGPILHVVRYRTKQLDSVLQDINSTGYGLTFGIHSRVEKRWNHAARHVHAGNTYINRSMIGATVGVQPFGGEGLSGTGPKAGGPYYLLRFVTERTFTVNTAAIGGNIDLLK